MYQTNISAKENDDIDKAYIGMTSVNLKFRYYNHLQSFRNPTLRYQSSISRYNWNLIELGLTPAMNWKIIKTLSLTSSLNVINE